jgi:hypothetical protein
MLNSDWIAASISLKKHLGLDWKPKTVKIADIQSGKEAVPTTTPSSVLPQPPDSSINLSPSLSPAVVTQASSFSSSKKKKTNSNKKNQKVKEKEEEESSSDDGLFTPIISTAQLKQPSKQKVRKEKPSQTVVSSTEVPKTESNRPLDLSDPNLYAEDCVAVPLWHPVEKRAKKKK